MGSPPLSFVDVPSLVFVVGLVGTGTLLSFSPAQVLEALSPTSDPETSAAVFHRMADLSVTSGIFGVIIGLIQMLRYLDDPTVIGPAMAVALLTTMYGAIVANVLAKPVSEKLGALSEREQANNELIMQALDEIQKQTNPRIISGILASRLPPKVRAELADA